MKNSYNLLSLFSQACHVCVAIVTYTDMATLVHDIFNAYTIKLGNGGNLTPRHILYMYVCTCIGVVASNAYVCTIVSKHTFRIV